uniref:RNA-directed DNA polymerase, eukaryota, reverse transcriptase zinc-binding domain protein n=1 Tax=Tanacetum cinerariifolium TaxID=118510 RepID=A0A6L2LIJ0_TANCI|nr:RNA-directed DNA polymerase, eukaryota, reverse transcriptase zinc-binding domain protein [Tanacetum cinerariifolium]
MVHGKDPTSNSSKKSTGIPSLTLNDQDLVPIEDSLMVLLVKVHEVGTMNCVYRVARSGGFTNLKIHHIDRRYTNDLNNPLEGNVDKNSQNIHLDENEDKNLENVPLDENEEKKLDNDVHVNGKFIICGDLNKVRTDYERFGSTFSNFEAQIFNSFIDAAGLIEIPMGGRLFTWMNKAGTKLSKLDRLLMSEDVLVTNSDLKAISLNRLWSDHNPILLHADKTDFGPIPFKLSHSWMQMQEFDIMIEESRNEFNNLNSGLCSSLHKRLKHLKQCIKIWCHASKKQDNTRFQIIQAKMNELDIKIESSIAFDEDRNYRLQLMKERDDLYINGSPAFEFSMGHGLHQGDPLSPFLFILVMEGLHLSLQEANHSRLIKGVSLINDVFNVSYFFFADDVDILTDWNTNDMENIVQTLNSFYMASRIKINIAKSNVYGVGVSEENLEAMETLIRCLAGSLPFTYLGLPIGKNMKLTDSWCVKWENILAPLDKGGLGVGSLKAFNLALLEKWHWRLSVEEDAVFSVASTRLHIDHTILPSSTIETRWKKCLPRKPSSSCAKSKPDGNSSIVHGTFVRWMILEPGDPDCEVHVAETFHELTDEELTKKDIKQMEANNQAI